jgi:hypothetical protein
MPMSQKYGGDAQYLIFNTKLKKMFKKLTIFSELKSLKNYESVLINLVEKN